VGFFSLSGYDKGKRSPLLERVIPSDLISGLEFSDRLWGPVKRAKKKLPYRIFLEGNHEHRIEKALDLSPEMVGTIDFKDLDLDHWYDEVVRYDGSTPGHVEVDGITYAHYFIGVYLVVRLAASILLILWPQSSVLVAQLGISTLLTTIFVL
jgi:hypothetical protein